MFTHLQPAAMQAGVMFRAAAIALAALVALDWYFLDSKYVGTVGAVARSVVHFVVG
jgi:hypothetical protein